MRTKSSIYVFIIITGWWTISYRGYHPSSSQCLLLSQGGGLLVTEGIIRQVVSVYYYHRVVDYQLPRVSSVKQSVFIIITGWWTISYRGYHPSSSQCLLLSQGGGLLVTEGIIHQVVSVYYYHRVVDYQLPRVSSVKQSVFIIITGWWTISYRGYHPSSSQCLLLSQGGGLLVTEGIIRQVVSVYYYHRVVDYQLPRVSSVKQSVFIIITGWWTISYRGYHPSSSQCLLLSQGGGLLVTEGIIRQVVSVYYYHRVVDYQLPRVSSVKQSVFIIITGWRTISYRGYHPSSSQCLLLSQGGGLLVTEGIIRQVVSVYYYHRVVDYQLPRVSSVKQSVFIIITGWWTISYRGYHPSSSQCLLLSQGGGLLVTEGIIRQVVSVYYYHRVVDYQLPRVSSVKQSVFIIITGWRTISYRGYHPSSSQCLLLSQGGGLLVTEGIIRQVVSVYYYHRVVDYQLPRVSSVKQSVFIIITGWRTISYRGYHPSSSQCLLLSQGGGLLVTEGIIRQVVSVYYYHRVADYQLPRVSSVKQSVFIIITGWWTISYRGYHPSSSQCLLLSQGGGLLVTEGIIRQVVSVYYYHRVVDYQLPRVSSVKQSVFIIITGWWTISYRGYHPSSSQCLLLSQGGGLLVTEGIIRQVVSVYYYHRVVDYQLPRVSSVKQSVFIIITGWRTISYRGYHPSSSQCLLLSQGGGLLVTEGIIRQVVSVYYYHRVVDYQLPRVSSVKQSVFIIITGWRTISYRGYHPSSSQCLLLSQGGGLLVTEGIIRQVVNVYYYHRVVDYQLPRVSSVKQSVFIIITGWWTISYRGYHPSSSQCLLLSQGGGLLVTEGIIRQVVSVYYYHRVVDYQLPRVSSVKQSVFIIITGWWTISYRGYHPSSSQCLLLSQGGGLLVTEGIIRQVVSVYYYHRVVDYQLPRVSSVKQSVFIIITGWWTISYRGYHPSSSQCLLLSQGGGLLVTEGIIRQVVSVYYYHRVVDYQLPRVSSVKQSVFRHRHCL